MASQAIGGLLLLIFIVAPMVFFAFCSIISGVAIWHDVRATKAKRKMKLEAVVVCVDYSDFLAWTLPVNKNHFDRMVVVTSSKDERTRKLCEHYHVQCVVTDVCYEDGATFNKGKMINAGLAALSGDDWVVHLDADIVLPPKTRVLLEAIKLDAEGIYSCDRMMCDDFVSWLHYWAQPQVQHEDNMFVHMQSFPMGVRFACDGAAYGGWIPVGYFQMWNQGKLKLVYPTEHTSAARTDTAFSLKFDRVHRHNLCEIVAIHLETKENGEATMGVNWNGRLTPLFGSEFLKRESA